VGAAVTVLASRHHAKVPFHERGDELMGVQPLLSDVDVEEIVTEATAKA
jgi:hypothetical protein